MGRLSVLSLLMTVLVRGQAGTTLDLSDAIRDGKVSAMFTGTGVRSGDAVRVQVKLFQDSSGPVDLTVSPGSMLVNQNGFAQNMVLMGVRGLESGGHIINPASTLHVAETNPATYVLSAFSAQFEKQIPSRSDTFFPPQAPDAVLACISREGQGLSVAAEQAAVWLHTDHVTFEKMSGQVPLGKDEWDAGEAVFRRCSAR